MDSLHLLGTKALASRLKRTSDHLMAETSNLYNALEIEFDAPCYPLFALILSHEQEETSLTEAADQLGITHAAVSQKSTQLEERGYIALRPSKTDKRSKVIQLTDAGRAIATALTPFWEAIEETLQPIITDSQPLLHQVARLEEYVSSGHYKRDLLSTYRPVEILPWRPEWAHHFTALNQAWLEKHFVVEPYDAEVLADPDSYILQKGGEIFFARYKGEIVGTCALMPTGNDSYEFTKMGVDPSAQGNGIGKLLLDHAIAHTQNQLKAREVWLLTSASLGAANHLYAKAGFLSEPLTDEDRALYARADRKYRLSFEQVAQAA